MNNFVNAASAACLAAFAMTFCGTANAAAISCSEATPDVTNNLTPNAGCEISTGPGGINNDSPQPGAVNSQNFFGHDDWLFAGKDNGLDGVDEGTDLFGLVFDGDQQSGAWSLTGLTVLDGYEIMLLFKGGTNAAPEAVVAYLLADIAGDYLTPFFGPGGQSQNISHASLYYREIPEVPLPGALWLMLAGLAGLRATARRSR